MTQVKKSDVDLLILGAGWSGLLAAYLFTKEFPNKRVLVLEKEATPGGLSRTIDIQGLKADIGGHALFIKNEDNLAFLKEIVKGEELLLNRRQTRIYIEGKYLHYPANLDFVWRFNKKCILNIFFDLFKVSKGQKLVNFEDWVKANYGETLYKIVFREYSQKVWGRPCSELSYSWAENRIGKDGLLNFLFKNFFKSGGVKERGQFFYYPRLGIGSLITALLAKMNDGFTMATGVSLKAFSAQEERLNTLQYDIDGGTNEVHFKELVSTIPLTELVPILPAIPAHIVEQTKSGIKYRSLLVVYLLMDAHLVSEWSWCYFPSEKLIFSRIHEPKLWSRSLAPEGKTLLSVEIFCDYLDIYWNMDDTLIVAEVKKALQSVGLLAVDEMLLYGKIQRVQHAYPLMYCGFEEPLQRVRSYLKNHVNLHLAGRNGTHSYFDMEECLEDVRRVLSKVGHLGK